MITVYILFCILFTFKTFNLQLVGGVTTYPDSICNTSSTFTWCEKSQVSILPPRYPHVFNYSFPSQNYECDFQGEESLEDLCFMTYSSGIAEVGINLADPTSNLTEKLLTVSTVNNLLIYALDTDSIFIPEVTKAFDLCEIVNYDGKIAFMSIASTKDRILTIITGNRANIEINERFFTADWHIVPNKISLYITREFDRTAVVALFIKDTIINSTRLLLSFASIPEIVLDNSPSFTYDINLILTGSPDPSNLILSFDNQIRSNTNVSLMMIAGPNYVHIFRLHNSTLTYPFVWSNHSNTMFYETAPGETITNGIIFCERSTRLTSSNTNVWMALLINNNNQSTTLKVILLEEFSSAGIDTPYNDPGNRTELCSNITEYASASGCTARYTLYIDIGPVLANVLKTQFLNSIPPDMLTPKAAPFINFVPHYQPPDYRAFFIGYSNVISVYGMVEDEANNKQARLELMSSYELVGDVRHITVSENGQHLFAFLSRKRWELESMIRVYEICQILNKTCDDDSESCKQLKFQHQVLGDSFNSICTTNPIRLPNLNDFLQYLPFCPQNFYCPKVFTMGIEYIEDGNYSDDSLQKKKCEPGFFCSLGLKNACPIGHYCPGQGNSQPLKCVNSGKLNSTCYANQLVEPQYCPLGSRCRVPYFPPLPSPPGYYLSNDSLLDFHQCSLGEYCSIGRHQNESRLCPANTYCPSIYSITPIICYCDFDSNNCSYCPEGTSQIIPCPAGNQCQGPANISSCNLSFYCPNGTLYQTPCPAGYYCSNPSEKKICPQSTYCKTASTFPSFCSAFSYCPPGTTDDTVNFTVIIIFLLVLGALVGLWKGFYYYVDRRRNKKKVAAASSNTFTLFEDARDSAIISLKPKQHTVDISFENLSLTIVKKKKSKIVLSGVNGTVKSGRVTAVMGPSGAGKTTFMTTLAGKAYYGKTDGIIKLNGQIAPIKHIRKIMGYVPQEDIMLRTLTVKDILNFNADMRLPPEVSHEQKRTIVNSVIKILGLTDVAHSPIGDESKRGISGGQRKRVNIGMELVADPTVLFLDEPTSGLDSTSSLELARTLRGVAELGYTVVTVIHQPRYDIFTMFHDVLLLGKGGRTVYIGPTDKCLDYFESLGFHLPAHSNPADFFMDIISGQVKREGDPQFKPSDLFEEWEKHCKKQAELPNIVQSDSSDSDEAPKIITQDVSMDNLSTTKGFNKANFKRKNPNLPYQLMKFILRSVKQQLAENRVIATDIFLILLIAVIFGAVFLRSVYYGPPPDSTCNSIPNVELRFKCLQPIKDPFFTMSSFVGLAVSLAAATFALRVFGNEIVVFWRESSAGVNTFAYFFGKDMSYLPHGMLLPLLFLGIFYTLVSPRGSFSFFYLHLLLIWYNATAMGYLVSVIIKPRMAQLAVVVFIFMLMLFSGIQPTLPELQGFGYPMAALPYISYLRYANEVFYLNEIREWSYYYNIYTGLTAYGYAENMWTIDWICLIIIGTVIRLLAVLIMHFKDQNKRL